MWLPYETLLDELRKAELETTHLQQRIKCDTEKLRNIQEDTESLFERKNYLVEQIDSKQNAMTRLYQNIQDSEHRCLLTEQEVTKLEEVHCSHVSNLKVKNGELDVMNNTLYETGVNFALQTFGKYFADASDGHILKNNFALLDILAEKHENSRQEVLSLIKNTEVKKISLEQELKELVSGSDEDPALTQRRNFCKALMVNLGDIDSAVEESLKSSAAMKTNERRAPQQETFGCTRYADEVEIMQEVQSSRLLPAIAVKKPPEKHLDRRPSQPAFPRKLVLQPNPSTSMGSRMLSTPESSTNASAVAQSKIENFFPKTDTKRFSNHARVMNTTDSSANDESNYFRMCAQENPYPYDDDGSLEDWEL